MLSSRRGARPRTSFRSVAGGVARSVVVPLLIVLVAGCSSTSPSPAASPTAPSSAPSAAGSPAPSAAATPAQSAPAGATPSSVPATASTPVASATGPTATSPADLRLLLPSSIGGHTLQKTQFSGTAIAKQPGGISTELSDTLGHFGKSIADLTVAFATDPTNKIDLSITAIRVAGVSGADFLTAYRPELQKAFPEATIAQQTLAGKVVDAVTTAPNTPPNFLIVDNDVVFLVSSGDATLATEAVAGLP